MTGYRDNVLDAVLTKSRNMMIPYYLMASYLYYCRDVSMLTDERYDQLCKDLDSEWDDLTHQHKHLIERSALKAGTAFNMKAEEYPTIVTHAATAMVGIRWQDHRGVTKIEKPKAGSKKGKFTIKKKKILKFGKAKA